MTNQAPADVWSGLTSHKKTSPRGRARRSLSLLPPAGTVVGVAPVLRLWKSCIFASKESSSGLGFFADHLGVRYAMGASSGRAALWAILKGLHNLRPGRNIVAIPAYTCFSVAASIAKAGLKLYPVEINPKTLDFDYQHLVKVPQSGLLCIVTSNLFGFVNDLENLRKVAAEKGAFVVDDAAQSLGATRNGYRSGTSCDVSFFSFGRGKPLPIGEGGVAVTNSEEIAESVTEQLAGMKASTKLDDAILSAKCIATSAFVSRRLFRIPDSLPFLNLGKTRFDPAFPTRELAPLSRELTRDLLKNVDALNEARRRTAAWITQAIGENEDFAFPSPSKSCNPTYLRFPIVAKSRELREKALKELRCAGIGASSFYPSAICDIPNIERWTPDREFHCPGAENLASKLLTLPTHSQVEKKDANLVARVLANLA